MTLKLSTPIVSKNKAIGKAVPLKETGIILPARHGGGQLIFIGRHVHRGLDDDSLTIGVDPKFLDTTFTEFNITKGSVSVPDVAGILDKAMGDKNLMQELSPSAYVSDVLWANYCGWLNRDMISSST